MPLETFNLQPSTFNLGVLLARVVFGSLMAAHGAQKLFGWFGGYGLAGTGAFFEQIGFRPGRAFAFAASATEVAAGLLITFGFLGPIGPALMLSVMIVAAVTVHWKQGLFSSTNGVELPLLYAAAAIGLAFTGYGQFSIDALTGLAGRIPVEASWVALALGILSAFANLALRRSPVVAPQS